jgi:Zn-dependent protease
MSSSFRIGRLGGVDVDANWTWVIVLGFVVWSLAAGVFPNSNPGLSSATYLVMAFVASLLFFASIVLHELGHVRQARREGMEVDGVTLWALGGVARFSSMFASAGAELRVAVAGPIVSLVVGGACVALSATLRLGAAVDGVIAWLGYTNLLLLGFNLIPALPLDGGRVLRALLWRARGDLSWATTVAARAGVVIGAVMIAVGFGGGFAGGPGALWIAFVGVFVLVAGRAEAQSVALRASLAGLRVRDAMVPSRIGGAPPPGLPPVDADADLATAVVTLLQTAGGLAAVVEDGELVGFLDAIRIARGAADRRPAGLVRS